MHKRERELTLHAAREVRGHLLLHPVAGVTMHHDLGHFARIKCYQEILRHYPQQLAALSLLPLAPRGAGPRETLWHAIIRRNYGCTDFIVECDHATPAMPAAVGPDELYPSRAAQDLACEHESELGISIFRASRLGYSPKARRYVPVGNSGVPEEETVPFGDADLAVRISREEEVPRLVHLSGGDRDGCARSIPPLGSRASRCSSPELSGSGKSTLAKIMYGKFIEDGQALGHPPRTVTSCAITSRGELGFSKAHRDINVRRIGFVASENHQEPRGSRYLRAPIRAVRRNAPRRARDGRGPRGDGRDSTSARRSKYARRATGRGLYALGAARASIPEFTGISDPYEVPEHPEITIDTTDLTPMQAAQEIFLHLFAKGYLESRNRERSAR